jgi:hypothetical protein
VGVPVKTVCSSPAAPKVHPVPAPAIGPHMVAVCPMLQVQFDPGSMPAASTSATSVATEGPAAAGGGVAAAATALLVGVGAGAVVTGVGMIAGVDLVTATGPWSRRVGWDALWAVVAMCAGVAAFEVRSTGEPGCSSPNVRAVPAIKSSAKRPVAARGRGMPAICRWRREVGRAGVGGSDEWSGESTMC